jgi:hypothetical protein
MILRGRVLLALCGVALVAWSVAIPSAEANDFGIWVLTPSSVGSPNILGLKSSIYNEDGVNPGSDSSNNLYVNRVDLEFYPNDTDGGLIQTGIGVTTSSPGLDACGAKIHGHDFMEYREIQPIYPPTGYTCYWFGTAQGGSEKRYTVGKDAVQTTCAGCYETRINGDQNSPPGQVTLATSYGDAQAPKLAIAGGEVESDDTAQAGDFSYGGNGSGDTALSWTNDILSVNNWNVVASGDIDYCVDTDNHWKFNPAYSQGDYISRRYATGASC